MPRQTATSLRVMLAAACAAATVTLAADDRADVPAISAASRATVPSFADVPMREHPRHVTSYTLRASLDPNKHAVHGEGTITFENVSSRPLTELWLHLYLNAFKNQSSVFLRTPVGGFRGTTVPSSWGTIDVRKLTWLDGVDGADRRELWAGAELHRQDDEDETDARVPLPRPLAPGETMTLEVTWDDQLPSVVERTGFDGSFHMVAQWFPKLAKLEPDGTFAHFPFHHLGEFYADYGRYDVTLDVPEAFTMGATGRATEARTEGGRRIERHVQTDVHDFAWSAWDRFHARDEKIDGVDVRILFPPSGGAIAERELATLRFALPHYGERYGRYPYDVLTVVHPPPSAQEAGGMEYPTLITTGGSVLTPAGVLTPELVTIHEFGHQYFYGLLASHETNWPFLDEGLNSYAEAEAMGSWRGPGSIVDMLGVRVSDIAGHAMQARWNVHDARIAQPAFAFTTGSAYGTQIYSRTATVLETLRRVYGDASMQRALGTYARRFRFEHPTPEALLGVVESELGAPAAKALRTALFDKGWVDYLVEQTSSHPARKPGGIFDKAGKRETVPVELRKDEAKFEGWALVARRGTLALPVDIELVFEDGSKNRVPWDGVGDATRIPYAGSSKLVAVVVDPERKVLLDQDPTNNHAAAGGAAAAGAPRVLERLAYWTQLLVQLVGP
jgi:hypothetical protein